jgi:hypothetical protein
VFLLHQMELEMGVDAAGNYTTLRHRKLRSNTLPRGNYVPEKCAGVEAMRMTKLYSMTGRDHRFPVFFPSSIAPQCLEFGLVHRMKIRPNPAKNRLPGEKMGLDGGLVEMLRGWGGHRLMVELLTD